MSNPNRIEKALSKWRAKWITDETRITIVACTSEPHEGNKKKFTSPSQTTQHVV